MPRLPTWAWIGIALLTVYLAWRWMGHPAAQSWGPIRITYDKIGQARDWLSTPYNSTNPGR